MSQSKTQSVVESFINILSGFVVAIGMQMLVFPWFGIDIPFHENLEMGLLFIFPSVLRSYAVRRLFNWYHVKQQQQWYKTEGSFYQKEKQIKEFCKKSFGPEHNHKGMFKHFGKKRWYLWDGDLCFRNEKDLTWFLLSSTELQDKEIPPSTYPGGGGGSSYTGRTGIKIKC